MAPDVRIASGRRCHREFPLSSGATVGAWVVEPVALATLCMPRRRDGPPDCCATQQLLLVPRLIDVKRDSMITFFVHESSFTKRGVGAPESPS